MLPDNLVLAIFFLYFWVMIIPRGQYTHISYYISFHLLINYISQLDSNNFEVEIVSYSTKWVKILAKASWQH